MLHPRVEKVFGDVVDAWLRYDDARSQKASLDVLVTLRMGLEQLRAEMHDVRRAHHPTADEVTEMAFAAYCDAIEDTVFIPYRSVTGALYRCWCGQDSPVPASA